MFHRHTWKLVESVEQQSLLDQLEGDVQLKGVDIMRAGRRDMIVRYACDCGAEKVCRV